MNQDLKFSATVYGLGAGLFFISYALFEVPSNMFLHRMGARIWIARIMVTWGIISMGFGFVQGVHSFYILRFLLGAAEAGFFPGIIYYLTLWYPAGHRAKPYAYFLSCSMVALVLMGPLSTWLMTIMAGLGGLAGWRWMFILEGLTAFIMGIVTFFYLKDRPEQAKWLTGEEKRWLQDTLDAEHKASPLQEHESVRDFLKDKHLWVLTGTYFFWSIGNIGYLFWMPSIIKSVHSGLSNQNVGWLNSIPFIFAVIGVYVVRWFADTTGRRKFLLTYCAFTAFIALTAAAFVPSPILAFVLLCVGAFHIWGQLPLFWTLPAEYLRGISSAAAIAWVSSWGGIGSFFGPYLVGWIKDATGHFPMAIFMLAVSFMVQGFFFIGMAIKKLEKVRVPLAVAQDVAR